MQPAISAVRPGLFVTSEYDYVTWNVISISCVTTATGLDRMLADMAWRRIVYTWCMKTKRANTPKLMLVRKLEPQIIISAMNDVIAQ